MVDMALPQDLAMEQNLSRIEVREDRNARQEGGLLHQKGGGRYQIVKTLPTEADSIDNAFDYADAFGTLRIGWMQTDLGLDKMSDATAIGGQFGFNTASFEGVSARVAAYTSQKVGAVTDNVSFPPDFFDENGDAFTYIAEANIVYENRYMQAKGGRIRIDTPYADSDDLRMAPNTFEGLWSHFDITETLKAQAFYLTRWAGFDSGEDQQKFKKFFENPASGDGSNGLFAGTIQYQYDDANDVSLWYYHVDQMSDIVYLQAAGDLPFSDDFHAEYGLQGSAIIARENSGVDGNVVGALAMLHYGMLFGGGAFNVAGVEENRAITDGFGGGPYYTSLDESTIACVSESAPGEDVFSYRYGGGIDFEPLGAAGLVVEYVYGVLGSKESIELVEQNLILTYDITEKLYFESVFAHYHVDKAPVDLSSETFDRIVARLDYTF